MIKQVTVADFRAGLEELIEQVQNRHGSVLVSEDGKAVAALIEVRLFERIRRMQARFDALCERIEAGYSDVPEDVGIAEIGAAIAEDRRVRAGADGGSA